MSTSMLQYQLHVGMEGWGQELPDGAIGGNLADNREVQAVKVRVSAPELDIATSVYYPGEGWSEDIWNGEIVGTTGKGKAIYGIRVHLEGADAHDKHISYRVRAAGSEWSAWHSDGAPLFSDAAPLVAIQMTMRKIADADTWSEEKMFFSLMEARVLKEGAKTTRLSMLEDIGYDEMKTGQGYFAGYGELDRLAQLYGTDKSSLWHDYTRKYEFFLRPWKEKPITLLELGVFHGASIKMWGNFFPQARVVGVDIDRNCQQYAGENREIIIRDLSVVANLEELKSLHPMIIVDDASHIWSHQVKALFVLFPALQHGGVYILEDLETNFVGFRGKGYDDARVSAYEILSAVAEVVTSREPLQLKGKNPLLAYFGREIECLAMSIEMISMIHGSCIMVKR